MAELADAADLKSDAQNHNHLTTQVLAQVTEQVPAVEPATRTESPSADAELAAVLNAWADLPEAVRAGIVAMVAASQ